MKTKRSQEGYLLIDNRASPGITQDFIQQSGMEVPFAPEGSTYESATITCSHCNVIVILRPDRTRPRGYCAKCDHYVCDKPSCSVECIPLSKVLDDLQTQAYYLLQG